MHTLQVPTGPSGLQAYRLRTVFEEVDMPWACPVEVNFHEVSEPPTSREQ